MKRLTYLTLPITVLLFLFLFPPITGSLSHAQTGSSIASPSDAKADIDDEDEDEEDEEEVLLDDTIASLSNALTATPTDADPIEITDIEVGKHKVNCIQLLMQGDSSASLDLPQLEGTIYFYRKDSAFAEKNVRYSVSYDTEAFDDTYVHQTGLFFLKASILLEDERYTMSPEASTDIFIPVFLYNPEQPSALPPLNSKLNSYDAMEAFHIVTDIHTDLQQINTMLMSAYPYQRFYVYFENGYYLNVPNTWDLGSVEPGVPGIYPAYRRPELPEGIVMEDVLKAKCSINIQDPNVFTLSSPISFGNNIVISWLYPTPDPSLFRLQYRIGEGDWIVDTDEYFMRLYKNKDSSFSLFLNPWNMEKDIHYQFQLEYDGVSSDILKLCVNKDGFYIPNEGDEDGGDRDNQTPPDVIQPLPETSESGDSSSGSHSGSSSGKGSGYLLPSVPESTAAADDNAAAVSGQAKGSGLQPDPKPSAVMEADTSTAAIWFGRRIKQYLKVSSGLPLIFEKDLIRVEIPADSPVLSTLSDSDFLHVEIQALSADTLRLTASLNEVSLTGIPLTVTMPWAGKHKPEDLLVKAKDGEWRGKVDKSNADGSITFTVTQSGVYTITPSAAKTVSESATAKERLTVTQSALEPEIPSGAVSGNVLSFMIFPAILILCSIGVILFLYYKRKKG